MAIGKKNYICIHPTPRVLSVAGDWEGVGNPSTLEHSMSGLGGCSTNDLSSSFEQHQDCVPVSDDMMYYYIVSALVSCSNLD